MPVEGHSRFYTGPNKADAFYFEPFISVPSQTRGCLLLFGLVCFFVVQFPLSKCNYFSRQLSASSFSSTQWLFVGQFLTILFVYSRTVCMYGETKLGPLILKAFSKFSSSALAILSSISPRGDCTG